MKNGNCCGKGTFFRIVLSILFVTVLMEGPDARALVAENCRGCHNDGVGSTVARHHELINSRGKQCLDCHQMVGDPGNLTPVVVRDCIVCHGDLVHQGRHHQLIAEQGKQCLDCHRMVADDQGSLTPEVQRDCSFCHSTMNPKTNHAYAMADVSCSGCHNLGLLNEHLSRKSTCYTCHSSSNTTVQQTILSGKGGTVVYCSNCHVSVNHIDQHNMVTTPADCKSCHGKQVVYEHTDRGSTCATCHQSTSAAVQQTITAGRAGTEVSCANCHGAVNHIQQHDNVFASEACAQCHTKTVLDEHLSRTSTCATCHSSTNSMVQATIAKGRSGQAVYCVDCHGQVTHQNAHDGKVVTPYADCNSCHMPNLVDLHAKGGFQCAACHASSNATVKAAVQQGLGGQIVKCADCHNAIGGFGNHAGQHDKITLSGAAGFIAAHEEVSVYCFECHTNTSAGYQKAINDGMAGIQQNCGSCHAATGNQPPTANAGADKVATVGQAISFTGSGTDPDGTIAGYQWTFGDGTSAAGQTVSKTYTAAGSYTVTLTVTDNAGATAVDTVIVTVTAAAADVYADQVQHMQRLSNVTSSDSGIADVTAKFRDGNLTDRYLLQNSSGNSYVLAMKLNRDALTASKVVLRLYVSSISASRTLRIYPYQSSGTAVNTGYYVNYSTSTTGWKDIDVTSIAQRMNGYGWMKFRITPTSSSLYVAEGAFQVQ